MPPKPAAAGAAEGDAPEVITAAPSPTVKTDAEAARLSLIDQMRDYFKAQPRVRVKVHNDADVPVQVNGYTFIVQAGVPVDVPEDVAKLLEEAGYI